MAPGHHACVPPRPQVLEVQHLLGSSFVGNLVEPTRSLVHVGDLHKISRHAVQRR